MANRIRDYVIVNHRLDPHETELHIHVKLDELTPSTELRGRLVGPQSAYASTIEIAYPMRELERADHVVLRVVIPEASWWHPRTPFLYRGPLELWQDGSRCERIELVHGIRSAQLKYDGLRLNAQRLLVRARFVGDAWSESDARAMHDNGYNAVVTTSIDAWTLADRFGFLALGTGADLTPFLQWKNELSQHVSNLGWIFPRADLLADPPRDEVSSMFYGVNTSARSVPPNADFLVCHERELAWLDDVALPKLLVVAHAPAEASSRDDVIGWVEAAS